VTLVFPRGGRVGPTEFLVGKRLRGPSARAIRQTDHESTSGLEPLQRVLVARGGERISPAQPRERRVRGLWGDLGFLGGFSTGHPREADRRS